MFLVFMSGVVALILALALVSVNFLLADEMKRQVYKILTALDALLLLGLLGSFVLRDRLPNELIDLLGSVATVFLVSQLLCAAMVILAVIVRAIYRRVQKPTAYSPARRRALKWGMLYPIMALAISLYGNRVERFEVVSRFYSIPVKKLPPELEGFKIAQISDIHLGAYFSLERLEKLLNQIAAAQPDLLAITGDIFDDSSMNAKAIQLVNSFCGRFKYGIYYCHGNHEHFRGIQRIEAQLAQTNIHWLVNQSAQVTSNLYVIGVDYPPSAPIMKSGGRGEADVLFYNQMKDYVDKALVGVPYNSVVVLLAHHPEFFDAAVSKNIPLTLAGHTHACQIIGGSLLNLFRYTYGLFENEDCHLYVSAGVGGWFPIRLGCPPEVVYFTLTAKA